MKILWKSIRIIRTVLYIFLTYNIDFHADSVGYVGNGINISCVFDRYKTDKNGVQIYNVENNEFEVEHCSANI